MAVFPFTVRATDSEGSYADRQFSITVRNSRVERFMIVNTLDAYTSPDGTTWTRRAGQGAGTAAYGNGFWLLLQPSVSAMWNSASNIGISIRKSTDGINYQYIAGTSMTFLKADGTPWAGASVPYLMNGNNASYTKMIFWNGKFWYMGFGNTQTTGTASSSAILWSSPDGVTWTSSFIVNSPAAGNSITPSSGTTQYSLNVSDGVMIIPAAFNNQVPASSVMGWVTSDGMTFTPIKNTATANTVSQFCSSLTRINGLYLSQYNHALNSTSQYQFSTDGLNWTTASLPAIPTGSSAPNQFFYMNGLVYTFLSGSAATSASTFFYSSDAINWSTGNFQTTINTGGNFGFSTVAKNGLIIAVNLRQTATDQPTAANTALSNGVRVSTDGLTFSSISLPGLPTADIFDIAAMS